MQSIARADRVPVVERGERGRSESSRESGAESETLFNTLWSLNMSLLHQEAHSAASSKGFGIARDVLFFDGIVPHSVNPKGAIQLCTPPYAFPGFSAPAVVTVTFQTVISYRFENAFLAHDVTPIQALQLFVG